MAASHAIVSRNIGNVGIGDVPQKGAERLAQTIACNRDLIAQLEKALEPVLRPCGPAQSRADGPQAMLSRFAGMIGDIEENNSMISDILNRLEI